MVPVHPIIKLSSRRDEETSGIATGLSKSLQRQKPNPVSSPAMESDNATAFEKEFEMEAIRVTSYHRPDFDLAVARTNPRHHDQVCRSLLRTINAISSTLGNLQVLPPEIVYEICVLLDIQSLLSFRHVNSRAQQIVRTTRGYEAAITHALEALSVILKTNIASWFTLSDLFEVLCTRDCHYAAPLVALFFYQLLLQLVDIRRRRGGPEGTNRSGRVPSEPYSRIKQGFLHQVSYDWLQLSGNDSGQRSVLLIW
ncbi:hypothetical protein ASPSYDRAFT_722281 [Aspergillus sydowii CBS 593.65]|uniref:F-box domain-containing protein n=1 Tax=Aspergillus sydowii CBS 593.65 TaxID=1036612 RepID=A0A1L9SXZ2_9EURO|nr:uncharacterized protein ASPSYDRAFT_722281 [Aspergillus sydowii CBS 593.65]OJJ52058.1 hypothetical protein ASPSYDRAFT_722281 [Aspergillus sydowii CBS 593.65]